MRCERLFIGDVFPGCGQFASADLTWLAEKAHFSRSARCRSNRVEMPVKLFQDAVVNAVRCNWLRRGWGGAAGSGALVPSLQRAIRAWPWLVVVLLLKFLLAKDNTHRAREIMRNLITFFFKNQLFSTIRLLAQSVGTNDRVKFYFLYAALLFLCEVWRGGSWGRSQQIFSYIFSPGISYSHWGRCCSCQLRNTKEVAGFKRV